MEESKMMKIARQAIVDYYNDRLDKSDSQIMNYNDTYIVWFSKTLQNWKALVSTTLPDSMYYEITYNGDKDEIYLDAYKKWENIVIKNITKEK